MEKQLITGEKIYLKPLEENNIKLITIWHNDNEIMTLFALTKITGEEYWLDWFEKTDKDPNSIYFGIYTKNDDKIIGYIHLEQIYWHYKLCSDIGILIGEKDQWSKGYGTEAMHLMIKYAFEELDLHRLELMTFDFNTRGLRLWDKCGFKQEGIMRKARLVNGKWHDVIFMALLKEEYEG